MRTALYIFAFMIGLTAAAILLVFHLDFGRFKPQAEALLTDILGRPLVIAGPMHFTLDLDRGIEISAVNVKLAGSAWSSEPDLASLRELNLRVDIYSLLFDEPVRIEALSVDGLKINLERDSEGSDNWSLFKDQDWAIATDGERFRLPVLPVDIRLTDTLVTYTDPNHPQAQRISAGTISQTLSPEGKVRLALDGAINDTAYALQISSERIEDFIDMLDVELALEGHLGDIRFDGKLAVADLLKPARPTASLNLSGPNVEYLFDILELEPVTSGPLNLALHIAPKNGNMHLDAHGAFGEFNVRTSGSFIDLQHLETFILEASAEGPDIGRIAGLLGMEHVPHDPFTFSGFLSRAGADFTADKVVLTVGQARLSLDGRIEGFPDPGGAQVTLQLDVPDIGRFSSLLRVPGTLDGPLLLNATVKALPGGGGAVVDASVNSNEMALRVDGRITDAEDFGGTDVDIAFEGPTMQTIAVALGLDPIQAVDQPFKLQASLNRIPGGFAIVAAQLAVEEDKLSLGGTVADQPMEGDTRLSFELISPDLRRSLQSYGMTLDQLPASELAMRGELRTGKGFISLHDILLTYAGATAKIDVPAVNFPDLNGTSLRFEIQGRDLAHLLPTEEKLENLAKPFTLVASVRLEDSALVIDDSDFSIEQTQLELAGRLGLNPLLEYGSFQFTGSSLDIRPLAPKLDTVVVAGRLPLKLRGKAGWKQDLWSIEGLDAQVGEARIQADGTLRGPPDYGRSNLRIDGNIPSLSRFSDFAARELPDIPAHIKLHLISDDEKIWLKEFDIVVGESDISGEFSLKYGDTPVVATALRSRRLNLTPFLSPEPGRKQTVPRRSQGGKERSDEPGKVIPDTPVPMGKLQKLLAEVSVHIDELNVDAHTMQNVTLTGSVARGALTVKKIGLKTPRGGRLDASLTLRPATDGAALRLRMKGRSLALGLAAKSEKEWEKLPRSQVNLALIAQGHTVRELASSASGYLKIESGPGRIDSGGARLFTNDFLTQLIDALNPFASHDPYTKLRCATVLVTAENGRLTGKPIFVMQTERLNIFANADVDLATEKIRANFKTVPQKGLGVSLSNLINP